MSLTGFIFFPTTHCNTEQLLVHLPIGACTSKPLIALDSHLQTALDPLPHNPTDCLELSWPESQFNLQPNPPPHKHTHTRNINIKGHQPQSSVPPWMSTAEFPDTNKWFTSWHLSCDGSVGVGHGPIRGQRPNSSDQVGEDGPLYAQALVLSCAILAVIEGEHATYVRL